MPQKRKDSDEPQASAQQKRTVKVAKSTAKTAAKKAVPAKAAAKKSAPVEPAAKKTAAKKKSADAAPAAKTKAPAKKTSAAPKPAAKPRKTAKKAAAESEPLQAAALPFVDDAVGDLSDGEAHRSLEPEGEGESPAAMMEAYRADTTSDAEQGIPQMEPEPAHEERARKRAVARAAKLSAGEKSEAESAQDEAKLKSGPEPKLERLQKILSQAGIASRRHAEEMIVAGRVIVNGQVVTQLGAKADPARDHIRVDGKMLEGAERHRTFLLNKPKGYVTTVSDPEGRPTVMEFFASSRERLYPVGRLDYQSEGLLLMSNDGELANLLTRAASGVEKTYLVKVAGQPTEEELEQLRVGVSIDREQPGSGRVRTAPASVRPVRAGDNPWFEVVLTEGRNRELRKMFNAIGHFVEKIRRVGYGPLVLDVEPGQFRELSTEELSALRLTAEGKLKPRRPKSLAMAPRDAERAAETRGGNRGQYRGRPEGAGRQGRTENRQRREPSRGQSRDSDRRAFARPGPPRRDGDRPRSDRPRPDHPRVDRQQSGGATSDRPRFDRPRPDRPSSDRPSSDRPRFDRPRSGGPRPDRPTSGRPRFDRPGSDPPRSDRPTSDRPAGRDDRHREGFNRPRPARGEAGSGPGEHRFAGDRHERADRPRPYGGGREQRGPIGGRKPRFEGPPGNRPRPDRPKFDRPRTDQPRFDSPRPDRGLVIEGAEGGGRPESRQERPQREFRPRREFRPPGQGGERAARSFSGQRPGGGQPRSAGPRPGGSQSSGRPGAERGDRGKPDGQRPQGQRRTGGGRPGFGGGFRKDRGSGPRKERG